MEEVINKSDGQLKDFLDDLVDYQKHVSKKDPLIKELSRPAASLNSSTYSSAASSSSSSDSSASSSASTSSTSSSSSSTSLSASSSPSQSQTNKLASASSDYGGAKLEMAQMEDLGKTAKILEHHLVPSVLSAAAMAASNSSPSSTSKISSVMASALTDYNNSTSSANNIDSTNIAQKYASPAAIAAAATATMQNCAPSATSSVGSWKTISAKRDKRRKKPAEKKILAKEIPGNIGDRSVDELTNFIESSSKNIKISKLNSGNNHKLSSKMNNTNATNVNNTTNNNNSSTNANSISSNPQPKPQQQQQPKQQQAQQKPLQPKHVQSNSNRQSQTQQSHQQHPLPIQQRRIHRSTEIATTAPTTPSNSTNQEIRVQKSLPSRDQQPQQRPQQSNQPAKQQQKPPAVVTFAHHIKVLDEDVNQYTFGFFDEQNENKSQNHLSLKNQNGSPNRCSDTSNSHQTLNNNNNHHHNQHNQQVQHHTKSNGSKKQSTIQKPKLTRTSPCSEEKSLFNYEQILKFISNAWELENNRAQGVR